MTADSIPMLRVRVGERGMTALIPEFDPDADLNAEQRRGYDALCALGDCHSTGAIAVPEMAESRFEDGERVSLIHAGFRQSAAVRDFGKRLAASADTAREFADWATQTAESVETEQ